MTYITIFDSRYLSRAIICAKSLLHVEPNAKIYMFCLDHFSYNALKSENINGCIALSPNDYENETLQSIKNSRTRGEYAWTLKPFAIEHVFSRHNAENCTYVDADLFFYSSGKEIIDHCESSSVILTPHNFFHEYDTSEKNGYFCAQYLHFKNDEFGRELLLWWRDQCTNWCYNRHQPGLFGDQKYLETIAKHEATSSAIHNVFAAPWNVRRYSFFRNGSAIHAEDRDSKRSCSVIFFHFHGLKVIGRYAVDFGGYKITRNSKIVFYVEYVNELRKTNSRLLEQYGIRSIDNEEASGRPYKFLRAVKNWLVGRYAFSIF